MDKENVKKNPFGISEKNLYFAKFWQEKNLYLLIKSLWVAGLCI